MEPLLIAVVVAPLVGALAYWLNALERRAQKEAPERAGPAPAGPFQLDVRTGTVTCELGCELSLCREGAETDSRKLTGAKEIETGDASFDRDFYLEGPPALVLALFDAETRELVRALPHVEILAGRLRARLSKRSARKSGLGTEAVANLVDHLTPPADPVPRLARNARRDPQPRVRLHNLLTLLREYPARQETRETLRAACADPSAEVRLRAALALGDEGRPALVELASGGRPTSGHAVEDAWSAGAIAALGEQLPLDHAKAILESALLARRPRSARECVRALGRIGGAEVVAPLVRVLLTATGDVAAEAARALGATGLPAAERPLLEALERGLRDARVAVAEALGRVGSVEAVPHLKDAEERYSGDAELRRATREAVAEIQSRLTGASPGQLSLAEGKAGQLSLADSTAGRLSPGEDKDRR